MRDLISQQRTVFQGEEDIVCSRAVNRTIVAPALYNHTYCGLQLLEQEDYIYAVENTRVDDLVGLRMEAPLDRVLRYSAGLLLAPELESLAFMNLSAAN